MMRRCFAVRGLAVSKTTILLGFFGVATLSAASVGAGSAQDSKPVDVRGVVRAEAMAVISSELVARVSEIAFKPGDSFSAGDVLLRFDCRRYEADLRALEADVATQLIMVDTNRQLLRHRAAGANDLALATAKHEQAVASAESLRVRTGQCVIAAPYAGRLIERSVDVFEMPQANAPLLKIVKDGQLEVELLVSSHWSGWLRPGFEFQFSVDETGKSYGARVQRLGAVVDPVSRTMKVSALLVDPDAVVRPGMSGTTRIKTPNRDFQ